MTAFRRSPDIGCSRRSSSGLAVDHLLSAQALVALRLRQSARGGPVLQAEQIGKLTNSWLVGRFWICSSLACGTAWTLPIQSAGPCTARLSAGKSSSAPLHRATMFAATSIGPCMHIGPEFPADLARLHIFVDQVGTPSSSNPLQCGQKSEPISTSFTLALGLPITKPAGRGHVDHVGPIAAGRRSGLSNR